MPIDSAMTPRSPCRILYLVGELHRGGLERQLYYLIRSIDRERYRPAVAVWNYADTDAHVGRIGALGVPIYGISGSSRLTKLMAFRRLVRELGPELIHSYSFHTNFAASWAVIGTRCVAVGSIRSDFDWAKEGSGPLLGRLSGRWPPFHVSNSFSAARTARRSLTPFAPARCEVVTNAVDLDHFQGTPVVPHGPTVIVGIGYFLPVKRWDRLVQAAKLLKDGGTKCRIRIFGGGPLRVVLQEQIKQLGVDDCVELHQHTDDVRRALQESTFVVLTSEREGCPNAIMEAMACGRAVVATDVGDIGRLVEDGKTGFIVPSDDLSALTDRIRHLVSDRGLCAAMGDAARREAEARFGLQRFGDETLGAYRKAGWHDDGSPLRHRYG